MNGNPISQRSITGTKRWPLDSIFPAKRLRSKIPRRKRIPLLPIVVGISSNSEFNADLEEDSSSSCLKSEVSVDSSFRFARSEVTKRPRSNRVAKSKNMSSGDEFRRITRSFAKKKEILSSARNFEENDVSSEAIEKISEISEWSCLDSVPHVTGGFSARNLKQNDSSNKAIEKVSEISESSCVGSVSRFIGEFSAPNLKENDVSSAVIEKLPVISESSCVESVSNENSMKISKLVTDKGKVASQNEADLDSDNEMTLSDFESELFSGISEGDLLENSFSNTDENFSERSSENSTPSVAFALFLQFAKQFVQLCSKEKSRNLQSDSSLDFTMFEEEVIEESYKSIRSRERSEVVLNNLVDEYRSTIDRGDQMLQQRLQMVNWMVEHSQAMELHQETLFLGVSLMDRFLSRGYFKSERKLQLLGIASVTLATRLEEVQSGNSIRWRSFKVESNIYSRCEVVAMEWLLLEVLNFQCMIPTTHNFLWLYLKAAKADAEVETLTSNLAILSLLDHRRLRFWPSTMAAGLVILACLATNRDASCLRVMETHVRARSDDLPECIQLLKERNNAAFFCVVELFVILLQCPVWDKEPNLTQDVMHSNLNQQSMEALGTFY